jgi:hypothetical protein
MPIKEIIKRLKHNETFKAFNDVILLIVFGLAFLVLYAVAFLFLGDFSGMFAPGIFISGIAVFPMAAGIFAFATLCLNLSFPDLYKILYRQNNIFDSHWDKIKIALWVYSLYIFVPCLIAMALL